MKQDPEPPEPPDESLDTPDEHPRGPDPREVARFLKEQPPLPVPPRTRAEAPAGLLARSLLGDRVWRG